jgi:hypothetical protein
MDWTFHNGQLVTQQNIRMLIMSRIQLGLRNVSGLPAHSFNINVIKQNKNKQPPHTKTGRIRIEKYVTLRNLKCFKHKSPVR